jgi:hypothetical protein
VFTLSRNLSTRIRLKCLLLRLFAMLGHVKKILGWQTTLHCTANFVACECLPLLVFKG